ncbi:unnamed protein product [Bursaphelenchus xylophilus]|uniref:Galectin n=1 Tax=Bursaphelenchus xylophilus TaxID=6326 RepID=A0A1I7SV60_BURXY|nr:unnamed protein product [Bursaphelenchus xylophilus]CAG9100941.1 unnamed protein product [Bursaphelenchus xylophilus]
MGHNFEFTNPRLPFSIPTAGGLDVNAVIDVRGRLDNYTAESFEVDLYDGNDIVLHARVRFERTGQKLVLNTYEKGKWKKEVSEEVKLHNGDPAHLVIRVTEKNYYILFNGYHIADFEHRLPAKHINKFELIGGIRVESLKLENFPHIEGQPHH